MKQDIMPCAALCALLISGCSTRPYITPIQSAITDGDIATVKVLVNGGANVDGTDNRGRTPLYYASWYGRPEMTRYLLSQGADPTKGAGWKDNRNALHEAAYDGHVEVAKILIAHGMDVNCRTSSQQTPLHIAASHRYPEMVRVLIAQGADVNAQDTGANTALTYVPSMTEEKNEEYKEVVEILLDAGADVNHVNRFGSTALHAACFLHNKEVVALLLKRGANPNPKTRGYLSPLEYAFNEGDTDIAQILRQAGAQK